MRKNEFAQKLNNIKAKYGCGRSHTQNNYYDQIDFKLQRPAFKQKCQSKLISDRQTRARVLQNIRQNFGSNQRQFSSAFKINHKPSINAFEEELHRKILKPVSSNVNYPPASKYQQYQNKPIKQYQKMSAGINNLKKYYQNCYNQYSYRPGFNLYQTDNHKKKTFFTDQFVQAIQTHTKFNAKQNTRRRCQTIQTKQQTQTNQYQKFDRKLQRSSSCRLKKEDQTNLNYNFDAFDQIQAKINRYLKSGR